MPRLRALPLCPPDSPSLLLPVSVLLLAGLAACVTPQRSDEAAGSATAEPIRLVDRLGEAEIDSPLLVAHPAAASAAEGVSSGHSSAGRVHEPISTSNCRETGDGVLSCGEDPKGFSALYRMAPPAGAGRWAVAVEIRAQNPTCVAVEAWDAVERRRLPLSAEVADWQTVDLLWSERSAPDALIGTKERTDKPDKEAQPTGVHLKIARKRLAEPCPVEIRSVRSQPLDEGFEVGLALLGDRYLPMPVAGNDAGLARKGVFLPRSDPETVQPPFDRNFAAVEALVAPTPTRLSFPLTVPAHATLRFSYGLSQESRPGDHANFEVLLEEPTGTERLWSHRLDLTPDTWHWHRAEIDLARFSGRSVRLILQTSSDVEGAFALWGTPTVDVPRPSSAPPNVIFVAIDTLRADRLSAYGHLDREGRPTSPALDQLAADGVLFERAISSSNWTLPSFASIFTGTIVPRHRLATFHARLAPDIPSLARLLRDSGWRTHAVLYHPALFDRLDQGFEEYFNLPRTRHSAQENVRAALDWLETSADTRFFLFLHLSDPHQPFTQPEPFVSAASGEALEDLGLEIPFHVRTDFPRCADCMDGTEVGTSARELARDLYDGSIRYLDSQVGLFLSELRRRGLYNDSLIVLTSDHGEALWEHEGYFGHGGTLQYDSLLHVPLVVKPPAATTFQRGTRIPHVVQPFDLFPTILELTGRTEADGKPDDTALDARSLVPWLTGRAGPATTAGDTAGDTAESLRPERLALSQSSASVAAVVGQYKYVLPVGLGIDAANPRKPALPAEQLFDLATDPRETHDLAAGSPDLLARLRLQTLDHLMERVGGTYLLVTGAAPSEDLEVECRSGCRWDPLLQFGRERTTGSTPDQARFTGPGLGDSIVLLARFEADRDASVRLRWAHSSNGVGEVSPAGEVSPVRRRALEPGFLALQLDGSEGRQAWLLEAPERRAFDSAHRPAQIDPQQEEALRALGYIE